VRRDIDEKYVSLWKELGGTFSLALFRLERSDVLDYIIDVLQTGWVANRIKLLKTNPPTGISNDPGAAKLLPNFTSAAI
jgi:hypothetical protein